MKKIIKIVLVVIVVVWLSFEVTNYFEYVSAKKSYNDYIDKTDPSDFLPGGLGARREPIYRAIIVQGFYKLFPSFDERRDQNILPLKPVIYLYPTSAEKVKVMLDYNGEIIADYPTYNIAEKGWTVTAYPDGKIIGADGKEYSYLFWEGKSFANEKYDFSTGFVVRGEDTKEFLQNTLSKMGLTPKEYNEFIVYWYPKMVNNKYNLIHFAGDEYTKTAPLTIIPKPDSLLRVFMVYKPIDSIIVNINPQEIKSFARKGFVVVEWGGAELK